MWRSIRVLPLVLMPAVLMPAVVMAAESGWTLQDIQVEGLVRLTAGNVTDQLPFVTGQPVTPQDVAQGIQTLFATGQFDDVQILRDGNTMRIRVVERPRIGSISLTGNKLLPEDSLRKGLANVGLREGEPLKQSALQGVENELEQQYAQQGRYDADVQIVTTPRPGNRVDLAFTIIEGTPARVVDVRVIGNTVFKQKDLDAAFAIRESSWRTLINRSDRYAREKLATSLENLRAMYLNRGYINFNVNNSQVNLSEDRRRVYIEVNISEGQVYQFGKVGFGGQPLYSEAELSKLVLIKPGTTYSQSRVTATTDLIKRKYGNNGYYFASLQVAPEVDEKTKTVNLTYLINPGRQVYVRRINFSGNQKTEDPVLRREMRQLEGALASSELLDLSKIRLERTGYFRTVSLETRPVPGSPDQVDVDVKVEEQPSGNTTLALGYSQSGGITFQAGVAQTNFLGTGNQVSIDLSRSETLDNFNISYLNPYYTVDGISRGYNLYYRATKIDPNSVQKYTTDALGGAVTFGYPINENSSLSATLSVDQTNIKGGNFFSQFARDYLLKNGGTATPVTPVYATQNGAALDVSAVEANGDGTFSYYVDQQGAVVVPGTAGATRQQARTATVNNYEGDFLTYNLNLAYGYNTLNRPIFPTSGQSHRVNLEVALPGGDVSYQKLVYEGQYVRPLGSRTGFRVYSRLGYGNDLPFYKNFYGGGAGSVRGYRNGTLGPRSLSYLEADLGGTIDKYRDNPEFLESVGGNGLIQGGLEFYLPTPGGAKWQSQFRPVVFVEGAQVFSSELERYQFAADNFRYSAGVGFTWITALGPLSLSYAVPLNNDSFDELKRVQFEIGRVF